MSDKTLSGALVDVTALVVALFAAKAEIVPGSVFVAVLFGIMGARVTIGSKKGPPGGGPPPFGGSGVVALLICTGLGIYHAMSRNASAT
jgi:hypothetical protein